MATTSDQRHRIEMRRPRHAILTGCGAARDGFVFPRAAALDLQPRRTLHALRRFGFGRLDRSSIPDSLFRIGRPGEQRWTRLAMGSSEPES